MLDKKANIFKVLYLYGKHRRICGGHKCESTRSYPGRSHKQMESRDEICSNSEL